jgi:hypothetical protein
MASLKYTVKLDRGEWHWQLFSEDGRLIASGTAESSAASRTAAMQEGILKLSTKDSFSDPPDQ